MKTLDKVRFVIDSAAGPVSAGSCSGLSRPTFSGNLFFLLGFSFATPHS